MECIIIILIVTIIIMMVKRIDCRLISGFMFSFGEIPKIIRCEIVNEALPIRLRHISS
jgi:hypothetical protein